MNSNFQYAPDSLLVTTCFLLLQKPMLMAARLINAGGLPKVDTVEGGN